MDFFSIQNAHMRGNSKEMALSQIFAPVPTRSLLLYGLCGGLGRSLLLLSDAIELQSSLLFVESLVLAAVDWDDTFSDILEHPALGRGPEEVLSPSTMISRIAYDGRFSGLLKSGPGFSHSTRVLSDMAARTAIIDYGIWFASFIRPGDVA